MSNFIEFLFSLFSTILSPEAFLFPSVVRQSIWGKIRYAWNYPRSMLGKFDFIEWVAFLSIPEGYVQTILGGNQDDFATTVLELKTGIRDGKFPKSPSPAVAAIVSVTIEDLKLVRETTFDDQQEMKDFIDAFLRHPEQAGKNDIGLVLEILNTVFEIQFADLHGRLTMMFGALVGILIGIVIGWKFLPDMFLPCVFLCGFVSFVSGAVWGSPDKEEFLVPAVLGMGCFVILSLIIHHFQLRLPGHLAGPMALSLAGGVLAFAYIPKQVARKKKLGLLGTRRKEDYQKIGKEKKHPVT